MRLGIATGKTQAMPSGTIQTILGSKSPEVFGISPSDTVYRAIELMNEKRVGALLVMDDGRLVGIISERDYARKVILMGRVSKETTVAEIMSSPVVVVAPDTTLVECMEIMTNQHFRHLPVVQMSEVVGLISIGDLVRVIIEQQAEHIEQLHNYIHGPYPG
jgi:CBS domain-containing protein